MEEGNWNFDDFLPHVGGFGRYQKILIWLICLPACIPCGFHAFNQLFMADVPDHWCRPPPQLEFGNWSLEQRKMATIPHTTADDGAIQFSKCSMYDIDTEDFNEIKDLPTSNLTTTTCKYGWEFDTTTIYSSIVIDFELVCSRELYPTIGLSILNIGGILGVYIFGVISDRFGRKISFFLCLAIELAGGIFTAVSTNLSLWLGSRFVVGLTIPAIYQIPFIIALELVGPDYRAFVTVMTCFAYTLGMLLLAAVAYFIRDWRLLSYATALPFLLYFIYIKYLPESPRWLLSQGRLEEVSRIMEYCAQVNGKELPPEYLQRLKRKLTKETRETEAVAQQPSSSTAAKKTVGVRDLFRTPNMRLKTILITFNWLANNTVYVGLSYYGPAMGTNEYLSFFLSALVEIPAYLFCWAVMDRWGRRWPLCLLMVIGGAASICTVLMPPESANATLVLYLIAKFAVAASFLILYPFAGELYPTEVRGLGIGFTAYWGGLGLAVIPFINYLGTENLVLPLVVMGSLSIVGGLFGLRLPETLFQKLPQTLEEGEQFGKDFNLEQCIQCWPTKPAESIELDERITDNLDEQTPLKMDQTPKSTPRSVKRLLVRQMSSLEMPTDRKGSVPLHYWY